MHEAFWLDLLDTTGVNPSAGFVEGIWTFHCHSSFFAFKISKMRSSHTSRGIVHSQPP